VGNAVVIDKIPAQAEKGKGKEIAEGLPQYEPVRIKRKRFPAAARAILYPDSRSWLSGNIGAL
jgi:hypothetical protein